MKPLLKLQFKSMIGSLFGKQNANKRKRGAGFYVLMAVLFGYLALCFIALSSLVCLGLLSVCSLGYNWLYFAFIGIVNLAFGVLMNVFLTQNTLYAAKDNEFLLSLPIKPGNILFVRMLSLVMVNVLTSLIIMLPAGIIYAVNIGFTVIGLILYVLSLVCFPLIVQSVSCVLGWLLNKLYSKFNNKAFISLVYMVAFLGAYIYFYPKLMNFIDDSSVISAGFGKEMAVSVKAYGWPLFAYGKGCEGDFIYALLFLLMSVGLFALVYYVIRLNYLKSLISNKSAVKRHKGKHKHEMKSPIKTICFKEFKRFTNSPVYLTNMGLGIVALPVLTVLAIIFKDKAMYYFEQFQLSGNAITAIIVCIAALIASLTCITAPSVSLEGKSLWIIKSLPITGGEVVKGKLLLHCLILMPLSTVCAFIVSLCFKADIFYSFICAFAAAMVMFLNGVLGLIFNLLFPRFDWVNEAGPCKQSMAVFLTMLSSFAIMVVLFIVSVILIVFNASVYTLPVITAFLAILSLLFYLLLIKWGAKRFEKISE
ncbi:MAG: hypothetical protein ACI39F_01040 [Acutalibacteraceae bacterium]